MTTPCYVIAILGRSPAVITELLWWLVVREDRDVLGIEVWTTDSPTSSQTGAYHLETAIRDGLWDKLRASTGDRVGQLPILPSRATPMPAPDVSGLSRVQRSWALRSFSHSGAVLEDIRTPEEAEVVCAALHDRVRTLRQTLPSEVVLVGSLAGGRKTMSAALQGAFTLQGRPGDRLLHVLTHHRIEACRSLFYQFVVPNEAVAKEMAIPVSAQVMVHDVRFPLLQVLLSNSHLKEELEQLPYVELWGRLGEVQRAGRQRRAVLAEGERGRWTLTVLVGDEALQQVSLTQALAETYSAIVHHPDGVRDADWRAWLVRNRQGKRARPLADSPDGDPEMTRNRITKLKRALHALRSAGLHEFLVESSGTLRRIPAARQVTVTVT